MEHIEHHTKLIVEGENIRVTVMDESNDEAPGTWSKPRNASTPSSVTDESVPRLDDEESSGSPDSLFSLVKRNLAAEGEDSNIVVFDDSKSSIDVPRTPSVKPDCHNDGSPKPRHMFLEVPTYTTSYDDRELRSADLSDDSLSELEDRLRLDHHEDSPSSGETDLDIARAPFSKAGGLPVLSTESSAATTKSEITDFGELMYQEARKTSLIEPVLSVPVKDPRKTLQERIFGALISPYPEKKGFLPKDLLSSLVTEACVREELSDCLADSHNQDLIAEYARRICEETDLCTGAVDGDAKRKRKCFRKIFVILVLIEKTPAILKFLDEDVNDSDLPLVKVPRSGDGGLFDLRLLRKPDVVLTCFQRKWSPLQIRNFEEWQWVTLSPFFGKGDARKDVPHFSLPDQAILPFTEDSRRDKTGVARTVELGGGFSRVYKVAIHPEHHNFHDTKTPNRCFAIKRLHSQDKECFKKEVEMLKKFSHDTHPHLISLLATYEQFQTFFLMFHWAAGDLQRYWKEFNPKPSINQETVMWVARQCKGIASGVLAIHEYVTSHSKKDRTSTQNIKEVFGHHGDIKPENVLWFPNSDATTLNQGTLKLSDFGLAEFSLHNTDSMKAKSRAAASPSYRAPEYDLEGGKAIGRSYDMWTLGCLYLEFITWMLGGWELVLEFTDKRKSPDKHWYNIKTDTFFKLVRDKDTKGMRAIVKPEVKEFIERLHSHEKCTKFIHEFLNMVRDDLLVVKKNDPKEVDRRSSMEICQKLHRMYRECRNSERYACAPTPPSE